MTPSLLFLLIFAAAVSACGFFVYYGLCVAVVNRVRAYQVNRRTRRALRDWVRNWQPWEPEL